VESIIEFSRRFKIPDVDNRFIRYNPESFSPQLEVLKALEKDKYHEYVIISPTQSGKTIIGIVIPLCYSMFMHGFNSILAVPDELVGSRLWLDKINPMINESGFSGNLPLYGVGSKGGSSIRGMMRMNNGVNFTVMAGTNIRESAQASISASRIFFDELDDFNESGIERIKQRSASYGARARFIYTSTIKHDDGTSRIINLYKKSTMFEFWYQCPKCSGWQNLSWSQVRYDNLDDLTAFDTARYECKHCNRLLNNIDKNEMLKNYKLVGAGQDCDKDGNITGNLVKTLVWGIRWSALDSNLERGNLGMLAKQHRSAIRDLNDGSESSIKQFYRDCLSLEFNEQERASFNLNGEILTRRFLLNKSEISNYKITETLYCDNLSSVDGHIKTDDVCYMAIPPNIKTKKYVLTCGCDVQAGGNSLSGRIYFSILAWDIEKKQCYDVYWGQVVTCPLGHITQDYEVAPALDCILQKYHNFGKMIGADLGVMAVDAAYLGGAVKAWVDEQEDNVIAVRGLDHVPKKCNAGDIYEWSYYMKEEGIYYIPVDLVRKIAQNSLMMGGNKEGAGFIPQGLGNLKDMRIIVKHYAGQCEINTKRGVRRWTQGIGDKKFHADYWLREDYLDCRIYNFVAFKNWQIFINQ
jgi:hypothetical protein